MQKLIVLGIIVMMITGCSVAANAYAGVQLNVNPTNINGSFETVVVGWMTDKSAGNTGGGATTNLNDAGWDGVNGLSPLSGSASIVMEDTNTVIGTSQVNLDFRAPIVAPTDFQIWRLKTYVENTSHVGASVGIHAEFGAGLLPTNTEFFIFSTSYTTQAACKAAMNGATQIWKFTPGNAGTAFDSGLTTWAIAAPTSSVWVDPDDDSDTSVAWQNPNPSKTFTVYADIVPEPASVLAIFSGLIGLVGFGIRRRK